MGIPPQISVTKGYYASLCWYGLKASGLIGQEADPAYRAWMEKFSHIGADFGFRAPLAGGPLFRLLYQIPGDINPATPDELHAVMQACGQLIHEGSLERFLSGWPEETHSWPSWYHPIFLQQIKDELGNNIDAVSELLEAWADFLTGLWDSYQSEYNAKLQGYPFDEYQLRCTELDIFTAWERVLRVEYPFQTFGLVICPESPTLASSLGPERVVIGSHHGWEAVRHTAYHEMGVRFVPLSALAAYQPTAQLILDDYLGLLKIIEAEICYRKRKLLPELTSDSFAKRMNLLGIIEWRSRQVDIPEELLPITIYQLYSSAKKADVLKY
jgi:hypothetical protein